jgi:hypothetical protein
VKVTEEKIQAFEQASGRSVGRDSLAGLEAILGNVPDVEPFTFFGYPDNPVFLHPCGTVVDAREGTDLWGQVQAGECDCENTAPWMRIYVERAK